MDVRRWQVAALVSSLIGAAACSRSADAPGTPTIALTTARTDPLRAVVVSGLQASVLQALETSDRSPAEWSSVLRVAVDAEAPAMLGEYAVTGRALSFTPLFPFDQGRQYHVRLDLSRVPGSEAWRCRARDGRRTPGLHRGPIHRGRAGVPERRPGSREPAADVCRVLCTDGPQERRRVHLGP